MSSRWTPLALCNTVRMARENEINLCSGAVQVKNWNNKVCKKKKVVLNSTEIEAALGGRPHAAAFAALYPSRRNTRGIVLLPLAEVAEVLKVLYRMNGAAMWPPPSPAGATGTGVDPCHPDGWLAWLHHSSGEHVLDDCALWRQPAWLQPAAAQPVVLQAPMPGGGGDGQPAPA